MLIRVKWHLISISLFLLVGLFCLYRQTLSLLRIRPQLQLVDEDLSPSKDHDCKTKVPVPVNAAAEGSYHGKCPQCSLCDVKEHSELEVVNDWDSSRVLIGAPTKHFRDNLRSDTRYLTTCAVAGFTNQFMTYVNMIYLAAISGRVPIIPPFSPGAHISNEAGVLPFGRIFNLTRLRNDLRRPILEWSDVKLIPSPTSIENPPNSEREQLGCWSTRRESESQPIRVNAILNNLQLDVSYTRVPTSTRHDPKDDRDDFIVFGKLVPYIFSNNPLRGHFDIMSPSPLGHRLPPDEQLSCFDHLYFTTSSDRLFEWEASWSPPWNSVGKHVHFTNELVDTAKGYLSRVFNLSEGKIPPFIAIHARRGDFADQCKDTKTSCFNTLSTFAEKVDEIRNILSRKYDKDIIRVLLTSDEEDLAFWSDVRAYGWVYLNHTEERTQEVLGEWFAPIVDIVSQSLAIGFIGTKQSTFSLVSARRVEDWNDGPTTLVPRR
ncbi:hypothetical protein BYT27DRAFT_7179523 [Phlegmacium glaucopus]|nr:hypothetical protein BYT27DRAFT_7179523 [Phlegmacium glaucopus]